MTSSATMPMPPESFWISRAPSGFHTSKMRNNRNDSAKATIVWGTNSSARLCPTASSMTIGLASCPRSFSASPAAQAAMTVPTAMSAIASARPGGGMNHPISATTALPAVAGAIGA